MANRNSTRPYYVEPPFEIYGRLSHCYEPGAGEHINDALHAAAKLADVLGKRVVLIHNDRPFGIDPGEEWGQLIARWQRAWGERQL